MKDYYIFAVIISLVCITVFIFAMRFISMRSRRCPKCGRLGALEIIKSEYIYDIRNKESGKSEYINEEVYECKYCKAKIRIKSDL